MLFKNLMMSLSVLPLSVLPTLKQPEPTDVYIYNPTPLEAIVRYSNEYGVSQDLVYSVLKCESGVNPNVRSGDSNKSHGIAQIKDLTFLDLEKGVGEDLDRVSYSDNIRALAYGISVGKGRLWTPYMAIKNGGSYTFKNSQTGKIQTVHCNLQKML